MAKPGTAPAQGPDAPKPRPGDNQTSAQPAPGTPAVDPQGNAPIVPDATFDAALPPLSNDINAPLEPMPADAGKTANAAEGDR